MKRATRKDGQETEPGGSHQARSESYHGEVLPDPMCPCVCNPENHRKATGAGCPRTYCGRNEKELDVFALYLYI